MLDWFVLFVPLAVLPIILLFAFVGCPLDESGLATAVRFSWGPGLGDGDVTSIAVTFQASVAEGEGGGSVFKHPPGAFTLSGGQLVTGDTVGITFLTLQDYGDVVCSCTVTGTVAASNLPAPLQKDKLEDEDAPSFHLSRDSSGTFHLT